MFRVEAGSPLDQALDLCEPRPRPAPEGVDFLDPRSVLAPQVAQQVQAPVDSGQSLGVRLGSLPGLPRNAQGVGESGLEALDELG